MMRNPGTPSPPRLDDIDRAKGLAILLVVFGHIVPGAPAVMPGGNDWYLAVQTWVYQFHMPFFMYLSGFVMVYSSAAATAPADYKAYLARRARRFLLPFFLFGLLILSGKLVMGMLTNVDNQPADIAGGLQALFWHTEASPARSIWYLAVIFLYSAVTPPLLWLAHGRMWIMLLIAALLYGLPYIEYGYLGLACRYFLFFVLGGVAAQYREAYLRLIDRRFAVLMLVFLPAAVVMAATDVQAIVLACIGLPALPALHALARRPWMAGSRTLILLGGYTFVIYLFNTIMIGLAKAGLRIFMPPWDGAVFLVYAPLLLAAGLGGPILLKRTVLRRSKFLDQLTG